MEDYKIYYSTERVNNRSIIVSAVDKAAAEEKAKELIQPYCCDLIINETVNV